MIESNILGQEVKREGERATEEDNEGERVKRKESLKKIKRKT